MLESTEQNWLKRFKMVVMDVPSFALFEGLLRPDVIPSFIFHKVDEVEFEEALIYLRDNRYRTLSIGEYHEHLTGKKTNTDRKVILTFDDGARNNWSVAYPILKKLGMKAVFYVNAGIVPEEGVAPTLEDVRAGKISQEELDALEERSPFFSWREARKMEASGLINIESHGWKHRICFISDRIIDFQRPDSKGRPVYSWLFTALDTEPSTPLWGAPVYPYKPRLAARRFLDDVGLRAACMDYVRINGEKNFFAEKTWHLKLSNFVREYKRHHGIKTRFEDRNERRSAVWDSLADSKEMIEERLGKKCEHFAYPWNVSGRLSLLFLQKLGFKTVFRSMSGWRMPRPGVNPHDLSRVEGYWIKSLPGKGRVSVWRKLGKRVLRER